MSLDEYLAAAARTPFVWGRQDCCTFVADWVLARLGFDPMADWRGRYCSAASAFSLIGACGGLEALWRDCAATAGFAETLGDVPGDVGLIRTVTDQGRRELVGAIRSGGDWAAPQWAVLGEGGLMFPIARPLAAWSI